MKRKNKYSYKGNKKGQGKGMTITLLVSSIIMTGLVIWLGMNDWNVEKSMEKLKASTAESKQEPEEESIEPTKDDALIEVDGGGDLQQEEPPVKPVETVPNNADKDTKENVSIDGGGYIEGQTLPSEPTYINKVLIASKKYPLPASFEPGESKEARAAFDKMAAEARLSDFNLTAFSTYRSFEYQTTLYERYVKRDGKEAADRYSARPGYSEHQTGLAFDIGEVNFEKHWASSSFGDTEAGKWVAANAHRFGFVMRYPIGKEEVTGYMHESWHFRYVGPEIAAKIFKQNGTLEEYLGIR